MPVRACCAMPCLPQLIAHFFADRCTHSRFIQRHGHVRPRLLVACCRCALRVVGGTLRGLCLHRTYVARGKVAWLSRAVAACRTPLLGVAQAQGRCNRAAHIWCNRASATHIHRCGSTWRPTGRPPLPCCCDSDERLPSQAKQNSTHSVEATLRPPARGGSFHTACRTVPYRAVPCRTVPCGIPC